MTNLLKKRRFRVDCKTLYMNSLEAAQYLRTSPAQIRNLVQQGRIPRYKPFGRLLFKRADLDRVIEASRLGGLQ